MKKKNYDEKTILKVKVSILEEDHYTFLTYLYMVNMMHRCRCQLDSKKPIVVNAEAMTFEYGFRVNKYKKEFKKCVLNLAAMGYIDIIESVGDTYKVVLIPDSGSKQYKSIAYEDVVNIIEQYCVHVGKFNILKIYMYLRAKVLEVRRGILHNNQVYYFQKKELQTELNITCKALNDCLDKLIDLGIIQMGRGESYIMTTVKINNKGKKIKKKSYIGGEFVVAFNTNYHWREDILDTIRQRNKYWQDYRTDDSWGTPTVVYEKPANPKYLHGSRTITKMNREKYIEA